MADAKVDTKPKKSSKQRLMEQVSSLSADDDDRENASKRISWILRHGAKKCNLLTDKDDYVKLSDLAKVEIVDDIPMEKLLEIINDSNTQKLRYELKDSADGKMIKALSKDQRKSRREVEGNPPKAKRPTTAGEVAELVAGAKALNADAPAFVPAMSTVPTYGNYPYPISPMAAYGYPGFGMMPQFAAMKPQLPPGNAPARVQQLAAGSHQGRLKSFNAEKGFGFIECAETHAMYGRDVFVHKANVGDLAVGTEVTFKMETNKQGMPQARDLVKVGGGPVKASKGKGKDKGKGKGKGDSDEKKGGKGKKKEEEDSEEAKAEAPKETKDDEDKKE